jgi:DNA-binding transcriptional ArsR family regulator
MDLRRDVFQAIADPTRRAILLLLSAQALTAGAIAANFDSSRPAVSKHLQNPDRVRTPFVGTNRAGDLLSFSTAKNEGNRRLYRTVQTILGRPVLIN